MTELVSGALVAAYVTIALFFLRFWRESHDRLFVLFSAAFAILAVQRLILALTDAGFHYQTVLYVLRLGAFLLIIVAIIDKNRRPV